VTHPDYPTQGVPVDEQRELAGRGALLERCFAPSHRQGLLGATFEAIRATGPAVNVLSTDLGQVANPPVEDGLALMPTAAPGGFSDVDVRTMAVVNTRKMPVPKRALVVSAHSADFVGAPGAIATSSSRAARACRVALLRERGESASSGSSPIRRRRG